MLGNLTKASRTGLLRTSGLVSLTLAACLGAVVLSAPAAYASKSSPVIHNDPLAPIAAQAVIDLQTIQEIGGHSVVSASDATRAESARQRYMASRTAIATEIANRVGIDPLRMIQAWSIADYPHQTALMAAFSQLGVPYRKNKSVAGVGFDCSGLTSYAWGVAGVALTHQSRTQIKNASPRTADTVQAGDLVYYPGHVSLSLGVDKAMVHSPFTGRTVEVGHVANRRNIRFADPTG